MAIAPAAPTAPSTRSARCRNISGPSRPLCAELSRRTTRVRADRMGRNTMADAGGPKDPVLDTERKPADGPGLVGAREAARSDRLRNALDAGSHGGRRVAP